MEDAKIIEKRIKSVSDTRKITNALFMIASTKLHQARTNLERTSPYFSALKSEIHKIVQHIEVKDNTYFYDDDEVEDIPGTYGYLIFTSDRGLAGSFNINVIKEAITMISKHDDNKLFVVGDYGRNYFKSHGYSIDEEFQGSNIHPSIETARQIAGYIMDQYDSKLLTKFYIIYTDFNAGREAIVKVDTLFPFHHKEFAKEDDSEKSIYFDFYPSAEQVLNRIIPLYVIGYIYSVLVDSYCAELDARMLAMDEANTNADNLVRDLTTQRNHIRQGLITEEIIEISSSVNAMKHLEK